MSGLIPSSFYYPWEAIVLGARPVLYLDARQVAGAEGAAVSSWADRSASGLVAVQAVAAKQPKIYRTTGTSTPVVRFDGGDGLLTTGTLDLTSTQAITIICVSKATGAGQGCVIEASVNATAVVDGWLVLRGDAGARNICGFFSGNVGWQYRRSTETWADLISHVHVYDKGQAAATEMRMYVNGTEVTYSTTATNENTSGHGNFSLNVGARNDGAAMYFNGDIAAIAVFARALPTATRNAVEYALRRLAGLV